MHELTAFQRDQLYVIAGLDEPRGATIKRTLGDYYDETVLSGRLYPNLDDLAERGLVDKEPMNERANSYTLTERGRRELEARHEWVAEHLDGVEATARARPTEND
jgi:DNA-binding PadR family transcriptional regulator